MPNDKTSPPGTSQPDSDPDLFKLPEAEMDGLEPFDETASAGTPPPSAPRPEPVPLPSPPLKTFPDADVAGISKQKSEPRPRSSGRRSVSVFWPLILIVIGGILLLQNFGYLTGLTWGTLWRLWPLLLIALGIDTLFSRRSAFGSILSALLILGLLGGAAFFLLNAPQFPWMSQFIDESGWKSEQISHPLSGVDQANVEIDWASVPLSLEALDDSPNLIDGTVVYRGRLNFDAVRGRRTTVKLSTDPASGVWFPVNVDGQERRWKLGLTRQIPLDLALDGGSGSAVLNLADLELEELYLDVASGSVDLYLPAGEYAAELIGGSGSLDLWLPEGVGMVIDVDGGSGSLRLGERFHLVDGERDGDGVWESENLANAEQIISMHLDVASGSVRVQGWE